MHCDGLLSSAAGRAPSLSVLKQPSSSSFASSNRISFTTPFLTQTRFASLKVRAAINEGLVKSISEMSFYELLGIPETVTLPEIKQAYKHLVRKYHPDVSPPERVREYTERFIRVQEAYETLSDPRRRAMYDRDIARGLQFAFSARKKSTAYDEEMEDKSEWKIRWQGQVSELKKRSMYRDKGMLRRTCHGELECTDKEMGSLHNHGYAKFICI